jgi:UPF0042 nucleotide-binding protein
MGAMTADSDIRFIVITGMSGAGRRTASHTLEDLGWYVVDNVPPSLLPQLLKTVTRTGTTKIAVVLDVRTRDEFESIPAVFDQLSAMGALPQILYLEASDPVIVQRQESVRRPHPLQGDGRLMDGITRERRLLSGLRAGADLVIDTSKLNVHQLAARVTNAFADEGQRDPHFTILSFGFKNGIPLDADMVLDVRFLPNPYWVPDLRPQTGLSQGVSGYVLGFPAAHRFLEGLEELVTTIAPGYANEGKRHATIAIGCTGGKHRSTAMTEEFAARLRARGMSVNTLHRDLGLE